MNKDSWIPETRRRPDTNLPKGWLPMMICGSLGAMTIGFGILEMGFGRITTLKCQRSKMSINCEKTTESVRTVPTKVVVKSLTEAKVEQTGRKFRNAYRVVLETPSGKIPLTDQFRSDKNEKEDTAEAINDFIADRREVDLTIVEDDRPQSNLFGLIFIGAGSLFVLMAFVVRLAIRKSAKP